jgi:pectate lyase
MDFSRRWYVLVAIGCSSGADAVSVQKNAHHVWFDHCDISDGTDGNLDITNAADYVTVSYTKFHYTPRTDPTGTDSTGASGHRFSNLVGGTDTPSTYDDANALNVTWHHDWWADNVMERQARVRFGHNHFFSDHWSSSGDNDCVRAGTNAHVFIESSAFTGVKDPHEFNTATDQETANIQVKGNAYDGTSGTQATGGSGAAFTPSYAYAHVMTAVADVPTLVRSSAGPE